MGSFPFLMCLDINIFFMRTYTYIPYFNTAYRINYNVKHFDG